MSSTKAVLNFVDAVLLHFPPFRWEEEQEKAWVGTMVKELGGFDAAVLDKAISEMVRTRGRKKDERRIPTVAECIDACLDARKWIESEKRSSSLSFEAKATPDPYLKDWREDDFANGIALNRADTLCVQAAKDQWIGTLHSFVRKHRRMPSATDKIGYRKSMKAAEILLSEIEWCKREAKDFDEAYATAVRGAGSVARSLVLQVGDAMLKRRGELIDYVLHGVEFRKKPARATEVAQ